MNRTLILKNTFCIASGYCLWRDVYDVHHKSLFSSLNFHILLTAIQLKTFP